MHPLSPRHYHRPRAAIRRLDRAAGRINPILAAVAIGFGVLYLTCLLVLMLRLPVIHLDACKVNPALPPAGAMATR